MGIYKSVEYQTRHGVRGGFDSIIREGAVAHRLHHGGQLLLDFNSFEFEPLAGPRPTLTGDFQVRWDVAFRASSGVTYGVLDVTGQELATRELLLVKLATHAEEQPELIKHLRRGSITWAMSGDVSWMSGVAVTNEGALMLGHSGEGMTEVAGALSSHLATADPFDVQMWAPQPAEIRAVLFDN